MPYTAAQLTAYYTSLTGVAPDSSTSLLFQASANQNAAGTQSDAQTLAGVFNSVGVQATFEVAESTYQFFTGATTSQAGLAYLEGTTGSGNANGLDTAYYNGTGGSITAPSTSNGFNTENRYYNFALNLATAGGAGASGFASSYGSLTFAQTVAAAYENIVGSANVGTANANAAIADITSRMGYFQQVAATRGGDATALSNPNASLALKAVVVGYILEEANKADVGTYAKALDQFEASVAQGNAIFNTNLLTTYQPGGSGFNTGVGLTSTTGTLGQTLAFTSGTDTFNTTAGNVTFVGQVGGAAAGAAGTSATLGPSDIVNAQGANNTLITNVVGTAGAAAPAGGVDASGGAILNGIQTIDVRSADGTAAQLNQSSVAQATSLNSYLSTGTVTFNNVAGSTTVGIIGNGTVQGGSLVANYVSGASENVSLTGGVQSAAQVGGGATTVVDIAPAATGNTVNLSSSGSVNSVDTLDVTGNFGLNITANQAFNANVLTDANLRTLNVSGSGAVNLGNTPVPVRTVVSTDTGGLTASFTAPAAATSALTITTAAGAVDRITIDNAFANTVINTGGGGDTIQVSGTIAAGASLNGSGAATLAVTSADYTGVSGFSAANRALITGFSTLAITDAGGLTAGSTYDANLIGAQNFTSTGIAAGTATVNVASGSIITQTGSANFGGTLVVNEAGATAAASTNDSLTLGFTGQTASGTSNVQISGIETVQVIANRTAATPAAGTQLTLGLAEVAAATPALTTLTFAGNESVGFGAGAALTALRTVSATAETGIVNVSIAAITSTGTTGITLTGGSAADILTFKDFAKVTGGAGADAFRVAVTTGGQTYSSIQDASAGDTVAFYNAAGTAQTSTGTFTATTAPTKIVLASTAVFQDYLDSATSGATAGAVRSFDFGGNTYVVEDNSGAATFQNGVDSVVQLAGVHTLTTATAGVFTIGS